MIHAHHYDRMLPPEYLSDAPIQCSACLGEFDADEDILHNVTARVDMGRSIARPRTSMLCNECAETCDLCGEWLNDELPSEQGPAVIVREWANSTKRVSMCALCAGNWVLGALSGEPCFDLNDHTRESIAKIVRAA